jgi:hypothetical protein
MIKVDFKNIFFDFFSDSTHTIFNYKISLLFIMETQFIAYFNLLFIYLLFILLIN